MYLCVDREHWFTTQAQCWADVYDVGPALSLCCETSVPGRHISIWIWTTITSPLLSVLYWSGASQSSYRDAFMDSSTFCLFVTPVPIRTGSLVVLLEPLLLILTCWVLPLKGYGLESSEDCKFKQYSYIHQRKLCFWSCGFVCLCVRQQYYL